MTTASARRCPDVASLPPGQAVTTMARLRRHGWTDARIAAQIDARRWQRCGRALVLHNGPLHPDELPRIGLLNCGPRAALTAFTALRIRGLQGWDRDAIHVLVPAGARVCRPSGLSMRIHWTGDWSAHDDLDAASPAAARAAGTFSAPRPACGILAAAVQQRVVTAGALRGEVLRATRLRHRGVLLAAIADIEQGAEALSEIDFARLCRKHGLPSPVRQAVRRESSGRRRYLDAEWVRCDGRRVVAEVDGALHLAPRRWWDDQLRQNELAIVGDMVLRFPSVVVRGEDPLVIDQLRRALLC